jgi:hypothetical protein
MKAGLSWILSIALTAETAPPILDTGILETTVMVMESYCSLGTTSTIMASSECFHLHLTHIVT